jgi:chorismate-pyruvate lyase/molybdopterin converting factor small subunit
MDVGTSESGETVMPTVWIPALMRNLTAGQETVQIRGGTVREVIDALDAKCPGLKSRLCVNDQLRPGLAIVIDTEVARGGLTESVGEASEVHFIPAISGGMMPTSEGPDLRTLFHLFPPSSYLRELDVIAADQMPEPYRGLLVHEHHMTVTVEAHHGSPVDVKVLERKQNGNTYARKILLALQNDRRVVQFGLVLIRLDYCDAEVRTEILEENTPLGRILINHNVLRRIEPTDYLRVTPGQEMMEWFGLTTSQQAYGRLALIHCDGKPAIELLEIVAPE